ncbi:MAG: DUF1775 domain-containing protein, partial [Blastococcus sp.]
KVDSLAFSVVQSYSDGKQVAWIEPTIAGAPEPQHPAPVLTLTGAAAAATPTAAAAADHTDHTTTTSSSGAATWIALVALLIGLVGVVLGWDARRRTVAS